jgi:hypothetical protein
MTSYNAGGPPAGNYTQTGADDLTGACTHSGGFWDTVSYPLTFNAGATLTQTGGNLKCSASTGVGTRLVMEAGTQLMIGTPNATYSLDFSAWVAGKLIQVKGTSGSRCFIGGISAADRMVNILGTVANWNFEYCDFNYMTSNFQTGYIRSMFSMYNCTLVSRVADWTAMLQVGNFGLSIFWDVTVTDGGCAHPTLTYPLCIYSGESHIHNFVCYVGYRKVINNNGAVLYLYGEADWIYGDDFLVGGPYLTWVYLSKVEITTTPANCITTVCHKNPPTFVFDTQYKWGIRTDEMFPQLFRTVVMPGETKYVVSKIYHRTTGDSAWSLKNFSISGGAGTYNDKYTITTSKVGYITSSQEMYIGGNISINVTLTALASSSVDVKKLEAKTIGPSSAKVGDNIHLEVELYDKSTGLITNANITAGTFDLVRRRVGVADSIILNDQAWSKADGKVYYDYSNTASNWQEQDQLLIKPNGDTTVVIAGITFYAPIPVINVRIQNTQITNIFDPME